MLPTDLLLIRIIQINKGSYTKPLHVPWKCVSKHFQCSSSSPYLINIVTSNKKWTIAAKWIYSIDTVILEDTIRPIASASLEIWLWYSTPKVTLWPKTLRHSHNIQWIDLVYILLISISIWGIPTHYPPLAKQNQLNWIFYV